MSGIRADVSSRSCLLDSRLLPCSRTSLVSLTAKLSQGESNAFPIAIPILRPQAGPGLLLGLTWVPLALVAQVLAFPSQGVGLLPTNSKFVQILCCVGLRWRAPCLPLSTF